MSESSYKGQNCEDAIAEEILGEDFKGNILDIGANGIELSNTYYFMQRGATGVLVEPSLKAFANLKEIYKDNPNAHLFNVAIGKENGTFPMWESGEHLGKGDVALLSTLDEKETDKWKLFGNTFEKIEVPVQDFKTFLEGCPIKEFEYISIDAESEDVSILKQMNLSELKCKVLIIEWNSRPDVKAEIEKHVSQFGMKLYQSTPENLIFFINEQ